MQESELVAGQVFADRYRIVKVLGSGGQATVYLAHDRVLGHDVALKLIDVDDPDEAGVLRGRFEREVKVLTRLQSDRVVRVFDHGVHGDRLYVAQQLAVGESLSAVLARGRMQPTTALELLQGLLRALDDVHAAGVLHRDIKPANVMVREDASGATDVMLIDFGIAKSAVRVLDRTITATGAIPGTAAYMSPEQVFGEKLGPSSDLFSAGLVVLEAVSGFDAVTRWQNAAIVRQLMGTPPDAAVAVDDRRLAALLSRLCAALPSERYHTAADALADLSSRRTQGVSRRTLVAGLAVVLISAAVTILAVQTRSKPTPNTAARALPSTPIAPAQSTPQPLVKSAPPAAAQPDAQGSVDEQIRLHGTPGCGKPRPSQWTLEGAVDGLHLPRGYDPHHLHPTLLVMANHKVGPQAFLRDSGWKALCEEQGCVILTGVDGARRWAGGSEDVELFREAVYQTGVHVCLDRRRVFAVGSGRGGRTLLRLAQQPWITAVSATGLRFDPQSPTLRSEEFSPKPAIWLHPTKSQRLPLNGRTDCVGQVHLSQPKVDARWSNLNECSSEKPVETYVHPQGRCFTWSSCTAPYVACLYDGGVQWPGVTYGRWWSRCEEPPSTFPAAQVVWSFFESLPVSDEK